MTTDAQTPLNEAPGPLHSGERIEAIDVLRGFALLGILVMNINGMATPMAAYFSPAVMGDGSALDFSTWLFAHLFFDLKMMNIFSMLFGAGLIVMWQRAEAAGRPFAGVYYRRILWLLLLGLLHSYLVWHGDILVTYALCGLVLFFFRRRSPRALLISGAVFLLIGALLSAGGGFAQSQLRNVAAEIEAKVAAGEEMTPRRAGLVKQWQELRATFDPDAEELQTSIDAFRGEASGVLAANAHEAVMMHTQAIPFELFWRAMGLMLLGMAAMKSGVFSAQRTPSYYRRWVLVGLGIGLPIVGFGAWQLSAHNFDFIARFKADFIYNYCASILVSMAYVGIIMRACQADIAAGLRSRLAAVGRTALSNYLLQSLIGVTIFYGYGFGLFSQVSRFGLWSVILSIWAAQLIWSQAWLARFRFGPVEWLWRSLTYWQRQPLKAAAS
ncbi:MAG: DUF418 domain-containing protein [Gammaproteobacteria bacterium]|nr:DUF418 domain-containing protein [Gammaproteobacteria bacterium]